MKQKVIVVVSKNLSPTEKLEEELAKYGDGWKVVSATTSLSPFGNLPSVQAYDLGSTPEAAAHVYYATTVIIERVG